MNNMHIYKCKIRNIYKSKEINCYNTIRNNYSTFNNKISLKSYI